MILSCVPVFCRFAEALVLLERGLALVKKLGDALGTYRWPASQVIIDESKPGKSLVITLYTYSTATKISHTKQYIKLVIAYIGVQFSNTNIYLVPTSQAKH